MIKKYRIPKNKKLFAAMLVVAIVAVTIPAVRPLVTHAADTGFLAPSQTHSPNQWDNGNRAFTSNNQYATQNNEEDEQAYQNFNFSLPSGAVINGIQAQVEAKSNRANGVCSLFTRMSWRNGNLDNSEFTAVKSAPLTTSDSQLSFGGSSDTWGRTWTTGNFSNSNFVFKMEFRDTNGNSCPNNNTLVSVDQVQVKVFYTPPAQPVANPVLSESCGLDVSLVLDNSSSISGGELTTMKNAFHGFVNAFLPATNTQFSVVKFNSNGTVVQAFTGNAATANSAISAVSASSGHTNWEAGLSKAASTFDPRPDHPNLIVFASDGNPNRTVASPGSDVSESLAVNAAIIQSNTIKTGGTRVITFGIGNDLDVANLQAISGPNVNTGANADVVTSGFNTLSADLATLAQQMCGGTITVTKLIDHDGNVQTTDDQTPAADWNFDIAGHNEVTDATGKTDAVSVDAGVYSVGETQKDGYKLISAICKSGENTTGIQNDGPSVAGINVGQNDIISCTFINAPLPKLTVTKTVVGNDNVDISTFILHVKSGDSDVTGSPFGGSAGGTHFTLSPDTYNVSELEGAYTTTFGGDCAETGSVVLHYGDNKTCNVINTFEQPDNGSIVVIKHVNNNHGGTKGPEDFIVRITHLNDEDTITDASGNGTATADDLDAGTYTVSEDSLPTGYIQTGISCVDGDDEPVAGSTVDLETGHNVVCTITNEDVQPTLTVTKEVKNSDVAASAFPLFVTPQGGDPVSVTTGESKGFDAGTYTVSETNKDNFTSSFSGDCNVETHTVTLNLGDHKNCTITNTFTPPPHETTFHFIKQICDSYGDINGNGMADQHDATSGHFVGFKNYSADEQHFPDTYSPKPISPAEITDPNCHPAAGWHFNLSTANPDSEGAPLPSFTTGPTGEDGTVDVALADLPSGLQDLVNGNGALWVSEVQKPDVATFATIRCYKDALNGDNSEFIQLEGSPNSFPNDVYCIAYNVSVGEQQVCRPNTTTLVSGTETKFLGYAAVTEPSPLLDTTDYTLGTPGQAVAANTVPPAGFWLDATTTAPYNTAPNAIWISNLLDGPPAAGQGSSHEDQWRLFTHDFSIPAGATNLTGNIWFSADNAVNVYLDGTLIGSTDPNGSVSGPALPPGSQPFNFDTPHVFHVDFTSFLTTTGNHKLQFVLRNWADSAETNPIGLIYRAEIGDCVPTGGGDDGGGDNNPTGTITGVVYNDQNSSGAQDVGEPLLSGWTVFLDTNDNGVLDGGEQSKVTASPYTFTGLADGSYNVRQVLQGGWTQTQPAGNAKYVAVISSANTVSGLDFGDHQNSPPPGGGSGGTSGGGADGCVSNCSTSVGSGSGDGGSVPSGGTPAVLGEQSPSLPVPQVLGATTELPRTGTSAATIPLLLSLLLLPVLVAARKPRAKKV